MYTHSMHYIHINKCQIFIDYVNENKLIGNQTIEI